MLSNTALFVLCFLLHFYRRISIEIRSFSCLFVSRAFGSASNCNANEMLSSSCLAVSFVFDSTSKYKAIIIISYNCLPMMGLGDVDFGVGETNKNTEFGLGPWTAVGRKLLSNGIGCC